MTSRTSGMVIHTFVSAAGGSERLADPQAFVHLSRMHECICSEASSGEVFFVILKSVLGEFPKVWKFLKRSGRLKGNQFPILVNHRVKGAELC